jgi:hypothetical protein
VSVSLSPSLEFCPRAARTREHKRIIAELDHHKSGPAPRTTAAEKENLQRRIELLLWLKNRPGNPRWGFWCAWLRVTNRRFILFTSNAASSGNFLT